MRRSSKETDLCGDARVAAEPKRRVSEGCTNCDAKLVGSESECPDCRFALEWFETREAAHGRFARYTAEFDRLAHVPQRSRAGRWLVSSSRLLLA